MATSHGVNEMQNSNSTRHLLKFMMLIGDLKHVQRTGWVMRNIPKCESVAGHMYRMGVMAFLLGRGRNEELDRDRCIKMALVHDMAECLVGDLTPQCGVSKEEKHRREKEAMAQLYNLVDDETKKEIENIYQEYEGQQTPEAKAVKDLDRFDMILQAFEYEKAKEQYGFLQEFFDSTEGMFTNPDVMNWVEELKRMRAATELRSNS